MQVPPKIKAGIRFLILLAARLFFACVPRVLPRYDPHTLGINLIGYYKAELGLGEALRYMAKAMRTSHISFLIRQFSPSIKADQSGPIPLQLKPFIKTHCDYSVNCIVINPDLIYRLPAWVSPSEWMGRYNIGNWFWELSEFPKNWRYGLSLVDEIWVNSQFNADTMRQVHQRVTKIPFAIEFETPSAHLNRAYFDLPHEGFLFLCTFDFHSSVKRKNPQATINAFLKAFPDPQTPVWLVLKTIHGQTHRLEMAQLIEHAQNDLRIIFLDRQLSAEQIRGLLNCADCYVSLHRSEGLGIGMAESMYLGKPVIATAYSGNMEFMNANNAALVDFELVDLEMGDYPHAKGQVWAQAKITDAAEKMQRIVGDPTWRNAIAKQGHQDMVTHHSFKVMGDAIAHRLKEIGQMLSSK
jgi:glycosyltransferase involved in cell wall biosynthesis